MHFDINEACALDWYYDIELAPGKFTGGYLFKNLAVTRRLMEMINVTGMEILDISTMEGLIPTLLTRRGGKVLATDSIDCSNRLKMVQSAYDVDFTYLPHVSVDRFVDQVLNYQVSSKHKGPINKLSYGETSPYGFDFLVSSGLLYHVQNPVDHLMTYRKLLRKNGYLLLETAAVLSDEVELIHDFRKGEKIWGGKATWYPSTKFLEIYLKALCFKPVSFCFIPAQGNTGLPLCRIAILAQATDEPAFSAEETHLFQKSELLTSYDFKPLNYYARVCGTSDNISELKDADGLQGVHTAGDLSGKTIKKLDPVEYEESYLSLKLADT